MGGVLALLLGAVLLGGCATQATRPSAPPTAAFVERAEQNQLAREQALRAQAQWGLAGRIALSNGRNGGSGRIEWRQEGARSQVSLSAPVTRQSWRLSVDADGARLEGLEGGTRSGADAAALLREATGWEIPVAALGDWVRGLRAPGGAADTVEYDADGRLGRLQQAGWTIDYRWPDAAATSPALPQRIDAVKGQAKVKLIVDQWQAESAASDATQDAAGLSPTERLQRALAAVNLRDPASDLRDSVAKGDFRAIGVCGFACLAPGLEGDAARGRPAGLRILDGSGDAIQGQAQLRLKEQAGAYARSYNLALLDWLRQHPDAVARAERGPAGND